MLFWFGSLSLSGYIYRNVGHKYQTVFENLEISDSSLVQLFFASTEKKSKIVPSVDNYKENDPDCVNTFYSLKVAAQQL